MLYIVLGWVSEMGYVTLASMALPPSKLDQIDTLEAAL